MNVFYRGLANPVEVSVPGVDPSQLQVSASGGSLSSRGGGNYDFTPPADGGPGDAQINVTATINGKSVNMGSKPFKVKPLPRPIAKFGGVTSESSTVTQGNARSSSFVEAFMPEDFVFTGIQVNIVSFEMEISGPGKEKKETCSGSALSGGLRAALAKVSSGDQIIIRNIFYTTNGTGKKPLGSMALTVK
jgi:hypothetical protein